MTKYKLLTSGAALTMALAIPSSITQAASPVFMQAAPITADERAQGTKANPSIVAEYGGAMTAAPAPYVERAGRKIASQSGLSSDPAQFNVTLLNSAINNAFAIPGGYIYSTRQLVALMNDEAELAGVLGHEVGHVAARHNSKRESAANRNAILGVLGQIVVGAVAGNSGLGNLLSQGIGTGTQLLTLKYSRTQETEADDLGIRYLVTAGYDPYALSRVLASLAAQTALDDKINGTTNSNIPKWASTHPDPASRVQRAVMVAGKANIKNGLRNRDAFLKAIDGMMYGEDPKQGVVEGQNFIHPALGFAFTAPAGYGMQNGTQAVSISGQGGQAQFTGLAYNGDLDAYVSSALKTISGDGSAPAVTAKRTTINGIPAGYVTVAASNGTSNVDVTVFAYALSPSQAFHFITIAPQGSGLGPMASMVQSFRKISAAEAAKVKPRYVRIVTAKKGDTVQSLSAKMAYSNYQLERFLVLNGLTANSAITAGQKVKIVTY